MARKINQDNFTREVKESATLTLIQFKAEWNGACQIIAPVFEDLERSYGGTVSFFINEIGSKESLEAEFGIHELPTILFFKHGKIVDYSIGLTSTSILKEKVEHALLHFQTL